LDHRPYRLTFSDELQRARTITVRLVVEFASYTLPTRDCIVTRFQRYSLEISEKGDHVWELAIECIFGLAQNEKQLWGNARMARNALELDIRETIGLAGEGLRRDS
jgi:hypothetical protein